MSEHTNEMKKKGTFGVFSKIEHKVEERPVWSYVVMDSATRVSWFPKYSSGYSRTREITILTLPAVQRSRSTDILVKEVTKAWAIMENKISGHASQYSLKPTIK